MSRSRNIKPGFFKNDLLAELPFEYRILFQGLWCEADREGRLLDRPKRLKAEIFPYDNVDVDIGLGALHSSGFVVRYSVDGVDYIQITNFSKHQNPHKKEALSDIPSPELGKHRASTVQAPEISERAGLIPDSLNLIPDSLIKDSVQPEAARCRFDEFWSVYPNKQGKKDAKRHWAREKCNSIADDLIAHVRLMLARDDGWRRGFAPMGSTYLNGRRWEDVPRGPVTHDKPVSRDVQGVMKLQELKNGLDGSRSNGGFPALAMSGPQFPALARPDSGNGDGMD